MPQEFNREDLEKEWRELKEKCKGDFINPKDMRRLEQVTSLLMTNGDCDNIQFKSRRGNGIGKGTHNLQHKKGSRR